MMLPLFGLGSHNIAHRAQCVFHSELAGASLISAWN